MPFAETVGLVLAAAWFFAVGFMAGRDWATLRAGRGRPNGGR